MVVLRDDARLARLARRGQQVSLVGLLVLAGGFALAFFDVVNLILIQTVALIIGFMLSQYGSHLMHRFGRSPRPDEVVDEALKPVARDGRMYHYLLPAPHVLLLPDGPVVLNLKFQGGRISATGDRWTQRGIGLRRIFGRESIGNPTREVDGMMRALAGYIGKHAPELAEQDIPMMPVIVFTSKGVTDLDVSESSVPAMHASKLRGFIRQRGRGKPLPAEQYNALREAFDKAVAHLP